MANSCCTHGRRFAALFWIAALGLGARTGCQPSPGETPLRILAPFPDAVLLSPETEAVAWLTPPLGPEERVAARLFAGVDAPDGPIAVRDLSDRIELSSDRSTVHLPVDGLPPGRSTLEVTRRGGENASSFSASRVLDRGGFASEGELHGAGVRRARLVRPSTVDPTTDRALDLLLWYPADPDGPADPGLGAVLEAPVAEDARALPAVVYSHGSCGDADAFTALASALARAGFVVASIAHSGNTRADPGCGEIRTQAISFFERPDDVSATLDWLVALPAPRAGRLVDPARTGLAGHSFGGQTTLITARLESRVRAALALAPPLQVTRGSLPLPVPTMIQGARLDTTTPFVEQQQLYELLAPPRLLLEVMGEGHAAFTDAASTTTRALVTRHALGFLGVYLAGDARFEALLAPAAASLLRSDRPALPQRDDCHNGLDDDGDGRVDSASDPACATSDGRDEWPRHDLRIELAGNGRLRGLVRVVLLGHEGLDLDEIDPETLAFGPGRARPVHRKAPHALGPEGGRAAVHFRARDVRLSPADTEACLTVEIAGEPFVACSAVP